MFDELDQYLTPNYNTDYWSDDASDHATNLLKGFGAEDWQNLSKLWPQRPTHWQRQLADAAFGIEQKPAIDLLVSLLRSPHLEVAQAAADSLFAMDHVWAPDESLRPVLERLRAEGDAGDRVTLDAIIARISSI